MANNIAHQRLCREFKEVVTSSEATSSGVRLEIVSDDLTKFRGEVRGPADTPYADGIYELTIEIPETYPFIPPKVKFVTRLWHPNVSSQTGTICLDILKDQWAASMTLRTVLLSIQALLNSPEPNDPQDAVVAKQCISNPTMFRATAQFWAQTYADAPGIRDATFVGKLKQIMDMGVTSGDALSALSCNGWDVGRSTEYLFS